MKDNFNREINYLRISVTDLCDLRCKYCMPRDGVDKKSHHQILSIERIEEIVKEFALTGINKVRITGGEPLVRNGIVEIVKRIKAIQGIEEVDLTTNGVKLKALAKPLFDAGLDRLNISLDTLDEKKYHEMTRIGNINNALEGIFEAQKVGFKNIKINTVLIGDFNDDEVEGFIDFANNHELTVRFIELMPIGESIHFNKNSFISGDFISKNERLEFVKSDGVSSLYKFKNGKGFIGLISPLSNKFCKDCNRIRLTADGKIKPCLHSSQEIDISNLSGEQLKKAIIDSIKAKPKEHHLESGFSDSMRDMHRIGG